MNEPTSTPRRPIVPGPSGIAAKAIAVREQAAQQNVRHNPDGSQLVRASSPMDWGREQQAKRMSLPTYEEAKDRARYVQPGPVGKLAAGIAGVMSEVGTIQKTGFNKFHNYAYATLQDLLFAVTPLMGKHGVCVIQNEVERTQVETRIMVTYEFSIFHTSGEVWPEKPRFTGMCIGRNSKGDYDDKAINKAHSAARKYFLLSLFQVPSGDFDDADEGPATTRQQPSQTERADPVKQPKYAERPRTVPGPASPTKEPVVDERLPHKIGFAPGMTADIWASTYVRAIGMATSQQEISEWDGLNDATLQRLSDKYPEVYEQVKAVADQRMEQLAPPLEAVPSGMPDPKEDPGAALNWIAQGLVDSKTLQQAENFWNSAVAPREKDFDPVDWELLLEEFKRNEIRLSPDEQEPSEAAP